MSLEAVEAGIQKAIAELELALDFYMKKDVDEAKLRIWNASSEAEYILFVLKIILGLDSSTMNLGLMDNKNSEVDMVEYVVKAQSILYDVSKFCSEKNLKMVYEKTWVARGYLMELQERIEKQSI